MYTRERKKSDIGGKIVKDEMKLKNHIEEHERLEKDCELGGKQFKDETKLKFHMKCEHEREKVDCEKCGKKADMIMRKEKLVEDVHERMEKE